MYAVLAGLGTGFSLIVVIGAQNALVLRQGVLRQQVAVVVALCAASDAVLITVGVAAGSLSVPPAVLVVPRVGGAAFLLYYGYSAFRRAFRASALEPAAQPAATVVLTCLAFTWLNPHVYVDTVLLLGTTSTTWGADRWWFGVGAACASVTWFCSLGFGARHLAPLFTRPVAWRVLDGFVAVITTVTAVSLLTAIRT
ncbi:LysE family transporter [Saccharothrix violaceirubra]|nr:LysE/ArgO family amino acid transporter [Saccharothrix violaceirubra]